MTNKKTIAGDLKKGREAIKPMLEQMEYELLKTYFKGLGDGLNLAKKIVDHDK